MTEFEINKGHARELADMVGNEIVEQELSVDVIPMVAYALMEDYIKIIRSAGDME